MRAEALDSGQAAAREIGAAARCIAKRLEGQEGVGVLEAAAGTVLLPVARWWAAEQVWQRHHRAVSCCRTLARVADK
jgi:hypothetical protein